MKRVLLHTILALISCAGHSQSNALFPLPLIRYQDYILYSNPATQLINLNSSVQVSHSAFTGIAGNSGLNYLNGNLRMASPKEGIHALGMLIHSEFDTEILKRNRLYLHYARGISVSSGTKIGAGLRAGFFNYSVKGSASSAGVSVLVPDLSLGLWLQRKRMNLGLAAQQALGSKVRPINRIYALNTYVILNADFTIYTSKTLEINSGAYLYYNGQEYSGQAIVLKALLSQNFTLEGNYLFGKGYTASAGFKGIKISQHMGELYFAYFHSQINASLIQIDRLEIGLAFSLSKHQETNTVE